MKLQTATLFSLLSLVIYAKAQEIQSPAEFLRHLMQDPSRVPAYGEGLREMDRIATMTKTEVRSTLPVVFEAIHSRGQLAQVHGGLALYAISVRPDGAELLDTGADEVLALLQHSENRLKTTAVLVAGRLTMPAGKLETAFLRFLGDERQPALVKPGIVFALVQKGPISPESAHLIGEFLKSRAAGPSVRNDTLNAVASRPSDDPVQSDLIILGLRDSDQNVRSNALHLLQRLGPNALKRASPVLIQLAQDPNENSDFRALAEKLTIPNQ